ncbi:MAG TPA: hypothetical protein VJ859_14550 [Allosphingosinicella sp.]|nr:hypothetical protein [Allosphingosinicella sp.]HJQ56510.1 hypothetical protein [Vineibacter sp.]
MGPAYFILAILGCGEGEAVCRQVAVTDALYASAEACTADTGRAVARYQDIAYPVVVAECRRAGARPASHVRENDVKLPADQPPHVQRATDSSGRPIRV